MQLQNISNKPRNSFVRSIGIFAVATVLFLTGPGVSSAATIAELQAQLQSLLAQLTQLQGGSTACYSFTRDLTEGSTGPDVTTLQNFLAGKGYFSTSATGFFGPITRSAVAQWQSANGVMPAVGYFGSISRSTYSATCTTPVIIGGGTGSGSTTNNGSILRGGAGSITVDDSNEYSSEKIEEREKDAGVLAFSLNADDESDVQVTSVRVRFENLSNGVDSEDFDDYAESVSVWFDGDKVGESKIKDFSESGDVWMKSITLTGVIIKAGDEEDITISVSALRTIDSKDTTNDNWEVDVVNVRFEDAAGVITTENVRGDGLEQNFDFVKAGENEDIEIRRSSDDLDASTLLVDEDRKSDQHEVFVFKLEAEDGDIDLEDLVLEVQMGTENYNKVVQDVFIEIDGEKFGDFDVVDVGTTLATLTFNIDGDFTIDADDIVDVVVTMQFRAQGNAYVNGETVQVRTVSVSGEGFDDVEDSATIIGGEHILSTSPATITNVSWNTSKSDTTGVIDFFFTVTAEEDDVDVLGAEILDDVTGGNFSAGVAPTSLSTEGSLARVSGDSVIGIAGGFRIAEGDTTRFRVRYNTAAAGSHEVVVTSVVGQTVSNDKQLSPTIIVD